MGDRLVAVSKASTEFVSKLAKSTPTEKLLQTSRPVPSRLQRHLPDTSESSSQESSSDTDELGAVARPKVYTYRRKGGLLANASFGGACQVETIKSGIKSHACNSCGNHWDACACTDSVFQALPRGGASTSSASEKQPSELGEEGELSRRRGVSRPTTSRNNRQKQLEALRRYEEKFRNQQQQLQLSANEEQSSQQALQVAASTDPLLPETPAHPMYVHVLDISQALSDGVVTWQPVDPVSGNSAPDETIFYSLAEGRGELVMFGGIQGDMKAMQRAHSSDMLSVTNQLYFLRSSNFRS